ncbi:MAG: DUF885 domain-containing protein, partial [Planctomycetota bacterium]
GGGGGGGGGGVGGRVRAGGRGWGGGSGPGSFLGETRSRERALIDSKLLQSELDRLHDEFDGRRLSSAARLSRRLFIFQIERKLARYRWREHHYVVLPGEGAHLAVTRALLAFPVASEADAERYVDLLQEGPAFLTRYTKEVDRRAKRGRFAPRFAYGRVAEECREQMTGWPFEQVGTPCTILSDLRNKLAELPDLSLESETLLEERAVHALIGEQGTGDGDRSNMRSSAGSSMRSSAGNSMRSSLRRLVDILDATGLLELGDHGVWGLPDGELFYAHTLKDATGLAVTADALQRLALRQVADIQRQMRTIADDLALPGDLSRFYRHLDEDPRFIVPQDEAGRARLLSAARQVLARVERRLPEFVTSPPRSGIVIEARFDPGAGPSYVAGDPARGLPAQWTLDLSNPRDLPLYLLETHVHRWTLPGRHLREALLIENQNLPSFRRALDVPAWSQGWDLYAAGVAVELGLTEDPYAIFGQLSEELWSACLLVVDTLVHHDQYQRRLARDWLAANTPRTRSVCDRAVDWVLLHPGESAAALLGTSTLRDFRDQAMERLGSTFDLAGFHQVILRDGPLPLGILEERVERWIASQ